jgi:hypothetical protein
MRFSLIYNKVKQLEVTLSWEKPAAVLPGNQNKIPTLCSNSLRTTQVKAVVHITS